MSNLSLPDLDKKLKSRRLGNFYILCGEESYLKAHYLGELKRAVLGSEAGGEVFNLRRFDGRTLEPDLLVEAVEAYPSFAERTFVEVRDYDLFKLPEDASAKLASLLSDLPAHCCLTFVYDALEYKPDKRKKLTSVIEDRAEVIEAARQPQDKLVKWICRHFLSHGKTISAEDAEYLVFLCGELMNGLKNEIDKIACYAKGERVTRADIEAAATPAVEAVVFDLTDELSKKNYDGAAGVMGRLFQLDEEPIKILALIGGQLRRLFSAKLIKEAGAAGGPQAILNNLKLTSQYQAKLLYRDCEKFTDRWYRDSLRLCAETDFKMKSTGEDQEELLTTLFLLMANNKA